MGFPLCLCANTVSARLLGETPKSPGGRWLDVSSRLPLPLPLCFLRELPNRRAMGWEVGAWHRFDPKVTCFKEKVPN